MNSIKNHAKRREEWKIGVINAFKWRNRDQYVIDEEQDTWDYDKEVGKLLNYLFFFKLITTFLSAIRDEDGKILKWYIVWKGCDPATGYKFPDTEKPADWKEDPNINYSPVVPLE